MTLPYSSVKLWGIFSHQFWPGYVLQGNSNVQKLRNILSKSDIGKLIHAFVTSRLDNCNPFLSCCSKSLQLIHNATRVLTGPNRNECRFKVPLQWFHITQFKYNFFEMFYPNFFLINFKHAQVKHVNTDMFMSSLTVFEIKSQSVSYL